MWRHWSFSSTSANMWIPAVTSAVNAPFKQPGDDAQRPLLALPPGELRTVVLVHLQRLLASTEHTHTHFSDHQGPWCTWRVQCVRFCHLVVRFLDPLCLLSWYMWGCDSSPYIAKHIFCILRHKKKSRLAFYRYKNPNWSQILHTGRSTKYTDTKNNRRASASNIWILFNQHNICTFTKTQKLNSSVPAKSLNGEWFVRLTAGTSRSMMDRRISIHCVITVFLISCRGSEYCSTASTAR